MSSTASEGRQVLFATSLVSAVLGTIHAFSVFLEPLEGTFNASRETVSLTYSFALVFLTAAVLFGPVIYVRLKPVTIYICVAIFGAVGIVLAGMANNIVLVWIGYSLIFGTANGLGYGFGLQFAARTNPDREGFAMGSVTAAYAVGAGLAPFLFDIAINAAGFTGAMLALATTLLVVGLFAASQISRSKARYTTEEVEVFTSGPSWSRIAPIWLAYGSAVSAGLMTIGHAAGIATVAGFIGWTAPTILAFCNLFGSLLFGWLADRLPYRRILVAVPLISAASLVILTTAPGLTIVALGFVGFAYGGTIAAYPAVISKVFPGDEGPRVYGRVFTAWGAAGLVAPWIAGKFYDLTGNYDTALWTASVLAVLSATIALTFKRQMNEWARQTG